MDNMNYAGAVLFVFSTIALMVLGAIGVIKLISYLNSEINEEKKDKKDDDNSHWNIPPQTGIH